jgi:hypothetical protein
LVTSPVVLICLHKVDGSLEQSGEVVDATNVVILEFEEEVTKSVRISLLEE